MAISAVSILSDMSLGGGAKEVETPPGDFDWEERSLFASSLDFIGIGVKVTCGTISGGGLSILVFPPLLVKEGSGIPLVRAADEPERSNLEPVELIGLSSADDRTSFIETVARSLFLPPNDDEMKLDSLFDFGLPGLGLASSTGFESSSFDFPLPPCSFPAPLFGLVSSLETVWSSVKGELDLLRLFLILLFVFVLPLEFKTELEDINPVELNRFDGWI